MIRKLKSTSGETITEVLVAALVVVLGVLLYTMMVQSSFRIINKSEDAMKDLYDAESKAELVKNEERTETASLGNNLFYDGDSAQTVKFYEDPKVGLKAYTYGE